MIFTFVMPVTGHTVQYKVVDRLSNTIQDWTSSGIEERTLDTTFGFYEYSVDYTVPSDTFKGDMLWKSTTDTSFWGFNKIGY